MPGFMRGSLDSIGNLPEGVVETLKGLGVFDPDAGYDDLPELDRDNSDFISITGQGEEHVTHKGLIDMAHRDGLALTYTEPVVIPDSDGVKNDDQPVVFRAIVATRRGVFTGYGDSRPSDTMVDANIRMAETRALNRALRDAVNVASATAEEMPDIDTGEVKVE